jgi:hypothetical protein
MRTLLVVLIIEVLINAGPGHAQDLQTAGATPGRAARQIDLHVNRPEAGPRPVAVVKRVVDMWPPLRQRLPRDQRLRLLGGVVGVGILAYQGTSGTRKLPLNLVGGEALRIGLDPQILAVRERTGFQLRPSIGRRRFVVTLHRTF